jgi:hypothetical protein
MADESNVGGLLGILPNRKRFFWSPDYSDDIRYLQSLDSNNSDEKTPFLTFLKQYPSFEEIKDPAVKAKTLSGIISEFQFSQQYKSYINEQRESLSPNNYAKFESYVTNLRDTTFEAKMARAEAFVTSDLGRQWDDTREKSNIGRFGNLWHATAGRHLAAPAHRLLKPFQLRFKAFRDTSSQKAKFFGLVLGTAVTGVAAVGLLTVALPAAIAAGTFAAVAAGLATAGCGALTAFFASKAPQAIRDLQQANAVARAERINSQKEFEAKNDMYRNGPELSKDSKDSVIAIHGITESDFNGNALLDVRNGNVLLPEAMHLKYGGCATLKFDRIKNQLLITLDNIDGQTPDENAKMIREIAEACTGKTVGKATVLGTSCDTIDAMTKVLKENAETVLLNNRLADLENALPVEMDKILTKALLSGTPQDSSGGIAQYAATAAQVLNVSAGNDQRVYDAFKTRAETKLQEALRELTGKQNITLEQANPVTTAAAQIMGNVIENYDTLGENEQKLALANLALGNVPKGYEKYANTIATAAAIEASRLGVTEQGFKKVRDSVESWKIDAQDETSNIDIFTSNVLTGLGIKVSGNSSNLKEISSQLRASATEIVNGTFPQNFSVSPEAWQVAAQREAVGTRT